MGKLKWGKRAFALFLLCATTAIALPAQTFTTLHSFDYTDGADPFAALVQATNGNLYGTTAGGGASDAGTVFKSTPSGALTTLYSFCSQSGCTDGDSPYAGLVQATNGSFYGTTNIGGASDEGAVFQITLSGTLKTLYSFCSQSGCADGNSPVAGLVQVTNRNFYGTTQSDGANGYGTVFKITPSGTLTTLYSFCSQSGCKDGATPYAGLIQATDGNFYGTTDGGGVNSGTVFEISPSGRLTTLHSFCSQKGLHGRRLPRRRAGPGHRWELLRDNGRWRGQRRRHGLQNHPKWQADDALQLLLAKRLRGRRSARSGAGPGHGRELLRDDGGRWG